MNPQRRRNLRVVVPCAVKLLGRKSATVPSDRARDGRQFMMMDVWSMPIGMMLGMGLILLLLIVFLVLAIAACIKYLRS